MTHLDLFSGIGGFHIAAEWAGFATVGFSEIDPFCCRLLEQKWPGIKNYGDIRTRSNFEALRKRISVISAGVPCQPASLAGKRRGDKDDRWLWPAMLDVVRCVEPAWCVFENPPGILTLDEFGGVLLRLESLGYQVRAFSVPANAVGAKHRRQRVFVIANRNVERLERSEYVRQRNGVNEQSRDLGGEALADADGSQRWQAQSEWNEHNGQETRWHKSSDRYQGVCNTALADPDRAGLEEHQSRQPGQCETIIGSSGPVRFRLTEPPLCRRADGVPDRSQRLKALGNAVVPQQAYPFFAAIAQAEEVNL